MANSKRRCKYCKDYFSEFLKVPAGVFCSASHAKAWADEKRANDAQKQYKQRTAELKAKLGSRKTPRAEALELAQKLARISRADDSGYVRCVSCEAIGKWNEGFDGGHYFPKSKATAIMLDQRNIWPQCKPCNAYGMKFGNAGARYAMFLVGALGVDEMRNLEAEASKVAKRTKKDFEAYIAWAKSEILKHEKRLGIK